MLQSSQLRTAVARGLKQACFALRTEEIGDGTGLYADFRSLCRDFPPLSEKKKSRLIEGDICIQTYVFVSWILQPFALFYLRHLPASTTQTHKLRHLATLEKEQLLPWPFTCNSLFVLGYEERCRQISSALNTTTLKRKTETKQAENTFPIEVF